MNRPASIFMLKFCSNLSLRCWSAVLKIALSFSSISIKTLLLSLFVRAFLISVKEYWRSNELIICLKRILPDVPGNKLGEACSMRFCWLDDVSAMNVVGRATASLWGEWFKCSSWGSMGGGCGPIIDSVGDVVCVREGV